MKKRRVYTMRRLFVNLSLVTFIFAIPQVNGDSSDYFDENESAGGREGECPSPYTFSGFCVSQCRQDFDCVEPRKCCFNGCAHLCRIPKGVKRGQCPSHTAASSSPFEADDCNVYCSRDTDCSNDFKCCGGRQCIPPADTKSHPKSYPMMMLPKPPASNTILSACSTLICAPGTQCRMTSKYDEPRCERLKLGTCPNEVIWNGPCVVECQHDLDCRDNTKCCRYGCGHLCTQPSRQPSQQPIPSFTCANVKCRSGYICDDSSNTVQCIPADVLPPPSPSYQLESKRNGHKKPGFCAQQMKMTSQNADSTWCYFSSFNNTSQCSSDQQCGADLKCCLTPCGTRTCQPPRTSSSNDNDANLQDNPCDGLKCGKYGRCIVTNSGQAKCIQTGSTSPPPPPPPPQIQKKTKYLRTPCGSQYCTPGGESCVMRINHNKYDAAAEQQPNQSPFQCVPNQSSLCTSIVCADKTDCVVRQVSNDNPKPICVPQEASENLCGLLNICPADSGCSVSAPEFACVGGVKNKFCQTVIQCTIVPAITTPIPVETTPRPQKPGRCPTFPSDLITPCIADCDVDANCPADMKCCTRGCSRICLRPVSSLYGTSTTSTQSPPTPPTYNDPSCHSALPCPPGQHCELSQAECIAAPCEPHPTCVSDDQNVIQKNPVHFAEDMSGNEDEVQHPPQNPCDLITCAANRHCVSKRPKNCGSCPKVAFCVPNVEPITTATQPPPPPLSPTCDGFQCPYGQQCEIQQVCDSDASRTCQREAQCVEDKTTPQLPPLTCNNIRCDPDSHCELRNVDDCTKPPCVPQPFCIPNEIQTTPTPATTTTASPSQSSCSYPCKYGFQCELRHIPCPSNSCPTIPLCVPQKQREQRRQQQQITLRSSSENDFAEELEPHRRHYLGL